jgi:hypothetical protein
MRLDKLVYRHKRNDTNEVFYIGMGNDKRPYNIYGRNKHWNNIVKKHGYTIEILATDLNKEDACELEMFLIQEYGISNLSNQTGGGEGQFNPSKEVRYKIGSANRGKKMTKEKKKNQSIAQKGKKHTKESKDKISLNHKRSRAVVDLQTGLFFNSLSDACSSLNVNYRREHLRMIRYFKNFRFEYVC